MAKNKDGLEAGAPVNFETMMRVNRERSTKKEVVEDAEPKPKARKANPKSK